MQAVETLGGKRKDLEEGLSSDTPKNPRCKRVAIKVSGVALAVFISFITYPIGIAIGCIGLAFRVASLYVRGLFSLLDIELAEVKEKTSTCYAIARYCFYAPSKVANSTGKYADEFYSEVYSK